MKVKTPITNTFIKWVRGGDHGYEKVLVDYVVDSMVRNYGDKSSPFYSSSPLYNKCDWVNYRLEGRWINL